MLLLLLCICCNVALAILFKYFDRYGVNNMWAIVINYIVCVIVASIVLGELSIPLDFVHRSWFGYAIALSVLFITGFNILALSFQRAGVALTAIIQKMSLVIPSAYAIILYDEQLHMAKLVGIFLALLAIILSNFPFGKDSKGSSSLRTEVLVLPLLTFLISGIIEIILFEAGTAAGGDINMIPFVATSFAMAGILGLIYKLIDMMKGGDGPTYREAVGGIVLGVPNFLTIYLLVYLVQHGWQGSVLFPLNNIGILILSAAVGIILFQEKLNRYRTLGLLLALVAIILIGMDISL